MKHFATDRRMNTDDLNLRIYTIYFLSELDGSHGLVRYYSKDLIRRHKDFCSRNPAAKRYKYRDILSYMKSRKYVYIAKNQIVLKHLFIHTQESQLLIFTVNPGSEKSGVFFVCQVCDRGFSSCHGLANHQTSDSHEEQLNLLLQFVQQGYRCPMLGCSYQGRSRDDMLRHFKSDKSIHVRMDPSSDEMLLEDCKSRNAYCELCSVRCTSEVSLQEHKRGKKHCTNQFRAIYRQSRQKLIQPKGGLEVKFEDDADDNVGAVLYITGGQKVKRPVEITICNTASAVDFISCSHFYFYDSRTVDVTDRNNVCRGTSYTIRSRATYSVKVMITPTQFGKFRIPVLLTFRRSGEQEFSILREIVYRSVPDAQVFAEIQPVAPYVKPEVKEAEELEVVPSNVKVTKECRMALERIIPLSQYRVDRSLKDSVAYIKGARIEEEAEERWAVVQAELDTNSLTWDKYGHYFNTLLHLEELQMEIDIAQYTMEGVELRKDSRTALVIIEIPGLAENRPSVLKGDDLYVIKTPSDGKKYEGRVQAVELNTVKVEFDKELTDKFINKMKFKVEFTINRFSLRLEHRAVSDDMSRRVLYMLFPSPQPVILRTPNFRFFSRKVEENAEQNAAVRHVVSGTSVHAPYLIYGPPGTGKTSTLVEAIKQVWRSVPTCRILVCAPQNAAADLLAERLLEHVDKKDVLRINAPSRSYQDVQSQKVFEVSNYTNNTGAVSRAAANKVEVEFPKRDILKQRKILVSTLVTSGRLVSADMADHFTHIFIDEAGHATEPETVIPLAGLRGGRSVVQVVLAGDPKQLGPVIRSPMANPLGKSLLERLMTSELYKKDGTSGTFNPAYVTKLVRSFRSHPDILEVPNSCFYDNELLACADVMKRERFCQWEGLPTKGFPMVFHGVNGQEEREGKSPSWFNTYEVMQVVEYVKLLMDCKSPRVKPEDIGIISPYHQQVNKILRGLKALERQTTQRTRNYDKITVGSVEKFQGSEREIIIISTVRSQDSYLTHDKDFNLGFVGNPKRFNVAVTRAKALLIVIGNPSILRRDKNWLRLISHIEEGGGFVGSAPPDEVEDGEVEDLTNMMESISIKDALSSGASEYQQQGNQEWRRKE